MEAAGGGDLGQRGRGAREQGAGVVDARAQHELRGREAEHPPHPPLEHRGRAARRDGHLLHPRRAVGPARGELDGAGEGGQGRVGVLGSAEILGDADDADDSLVAEHRELRRHVPAGDAVPPADELELVAQRAPGRQHGRVLLLVALGERRDEQVARPPAHHRRARALPGAPHEGVVDLGVAAVGVLGAEHHAGELAEELEQRVDSRRGGHGPRMPRRVVSIRRRGRRIRTRPRRPDRATMEP